MKPRLIALIAAIPLAATHAETTEDLTTTQWETTGQVLTGDDLVRFSYTQGVAKQTIDLSDYDNIEQLTYGADFLGCNNFIGGHCGSTNPAYYDEVVVKLYVGSQVYEQTVTTDYNQGWISKEWTVDMTQSPTSATLQFSGIDPGYWAGWYGAIVRNPYLRATYSWAVLEPIVNPVAPDPEPTTPTATTQVTSGALTEVITPTVSVDSIVDQISPDIAPQVPELQITPEPVAQVEVQVEQPDVQPEQVEQQEQVAEAVAEVKAEGGKVSAKAIATQLGSAYDPAAQGVMMALMNRPQIKQPSLTDTQFYVDRGLRDKSIKDRFWLDSLVSDVKWNSMVDSEWQR